MMAAAQTSEERDQRMAYRGDDEPEYIDDEEFYDADGYRGGGNVLGGSGSRSLRERANDAPQERDAGAPARRHPRA